MSPEEIIRQYQDKPVWSVLWQRRNYDKRTPDLTHQQAETLKDDIINEVWGYGPVYPHDVQILLQIEDLE